MVEKNRMTGLFVSHLKWRDILSMILSDDFMFLSVGGIQTEAYFSSRQMFFLEDGVKEK